MDTRLSYRQDLVLSASNIFIPSFSHHHEHSAH